MVTPVYCKDCNTQNSWVRYPEQDIKSASGKIFQEAYKCLKCGKLTWYPTKANYKGD